MRNTRQRQVILKQLQTHKDHPGADVIYDEVRKILPRISLGTVYRNLDLLSEEGLINKLEYGSGQKRFDPHIEPHAHFRCLGCGKLEDVPGEVSVPRHEEALFPEKRITGVSLEYTGYCRDCEKNS